MQAEMRRRLKQLEDLGANADRRDREEMEKLQRNLKKMKRRERQVTRTEELNRAFFDRYNQFYNDVVAQQTVDARERHNTAVARSIHSFGLQAHVRQDTQSARLPSQLRQYTISKSGELRSLQGCTTEPQPSHPQTTHAATGYTAAAPNETYDDTQTSGDYMTTAMYGDYGN